MSAFYFVKRSVLRAEDKMIRQNRFRKIAAQSHQNEEAEMSDEDEANIAVDEVDLISIEQTLLSR